MWVWTILFWKMDCRSRERSRYPDKAPLIQPDANALAFSFLPNTDSPSERKLHLFEGYTKEVVSVPLVTSQGDVTLLNKVQPNLTGATPGWEMFWLIDWLFVGWFVFTVAQFRLVFRFLGRIKMNMKIKLREEAVKSGQRQHAQFVFWKLRRFFLFLFLGWALDFQALRSFKGQRCIKVWIWSSLKLPTVRPLKKRFTGIDSLSWAWSCSQHALIPAWWTLIENVKSEQSRKLFFFFFLTSWANFTRTQTFAKTFSSLGSSDPWNKSNPMWPKRRGLSSL